MAPTVRVHESVIGGETVKATIYMRNGDVYDLPHGEHLFQFLIGSEETFERVAEQTPVYSNRPEPGRFFTLKHDGYFLTINKDSISHVEWGDDIGKGIGSKKHNPIEISIRELNFPDVWDAAKFIKDLKYYVAKQQQTAE